jgi:enoyl-[acyl-carrier protein] reductase I
LSFLQLKDKTFLITGVANRRSVAWFVAKGLLAEGAKVIFSVHSEARRESLHKLIGDHRCEICDVEKEGDAKKLAETLQNDGIELDGLLHSIAFANYSEGLVPFHDTLRQDFLQASQISAFSFVELASAFKALLKPQASCVTIGISDLNVTAESYGYMSPIKAALHSMARNLAKSFSHHSEVRFNVVGSGPLKTNSSAGIPGYMDNYLFAEKCTYRKRAVETQEVADATLFLLSPRSSGMNGQSITLDAGLGFNAFDADVVRAAVHSAP